MKKLTLLTVILLAALALNAQVAINTDGTAADPSAMLEVKSDTAGILIPRLTTSNRNALSAIAPGGLMVYDSDLNKFFVFDGTWQEVSTGNLWTRDSAKTYLTNQYDLVGIGTSSPLKNLHIVGSDTLSSLLIAPNIPSIFSNKSSEILLAENKTYFSGMSIRYEGADDRLYFYGKNGSNTYGPLLTIKRSGGVGINTGFPTKDLQVMGSDTLVSLLLTPNKSPSGSNSEILFSEDKNYSYGMSIRYDGQDNRMYFYGKSTTTTYGPNLTIERGGNVGVGTNNPTELFHVASSGDNAAALFVGEGIGTSDATLISKNTSTSGGNACYFESNANQTTTILKQNGTGAMLKLIGPGSDHDDFRVYNDGTVEMFNDNHTRTIRLDPSENGTTTGSQITLYGADGSTTIEIDGDYNGKGRISTEELQITGGSDLSEYFSITDNNNVKPGMLVSIDPEHPGKLKVTSRAYDKKVAGIVSGANNIKPGLIMRQKGTIADGSYLIALSGRVYCHADASRNPIEVGDLLTSSSTPGYAMKAIDSDKAKGAIIGKAMTPLRSGKGTVLVLVTLQ